MPKIKCQKCEKDFRTHWKLTQTLCKNCRPSELELNRLQFNDSNSDDWVECELCKMRYGTLWIHLIHKHGMTTKDYHVKYNLPTESKSYVLRASERIKGENNPAHGHGGRLSPFSKKFKNYKSTEEAEKKIAELIAKQSEIMKNGGSRRRKEYWIKKGYSEEEAIMKVSEVQVLFSKEICIEKYGEERGLKIWQDRQDRWQATLNSKSDEEKAAINKKKLWRGGKTSLAEREIESYLISEGLQVNNKLRLLRNNVNHYTYDITVGDKIIEYNGDFWHANPEIYSPDEKIGLPGNIDMLAKEKWELDAEKIKLAESHGYSVLVIWESEYHKNKEATLEKCLNFLKQ